MKTLLVLLSLLAVAFSSSISNDEFQEKMKDLNEKMTSSLISDTNEKKFVDAKIEELERNKTEIKSTDGSPIVEDDGGYTGPYSKEFYEGDILLTKEQLDSIVSDPRSKRQAQWNSRYPNNIWKGSPIPYSFDRNFPANKIPSVRAAIKFWESQTCVRFKENGYGGARVRFINGNGCYAMIGKTGGEQVISIGYGCDWIGTIAHEIEHTLGVWHTQARYDRGNYVSVNAWNVLPNQLYNFNTQSQSYTNLFGIPYEFGSVMHYAWNDFARDRSRPTIVARNGYERLQNSMSNYLPTFYDIKLINTYYKCYDACPRKMTCQNGGLQDVNNCNRCKCPSGFSGTTCELISTSGCDRSYTIGSTPVNITATAGSNRLYSITYNECALHLKPATKGRRIEVTVTTGSGMTSWNCYGAGVDVRVAADPAMTGIRICRPNTRFQPIVSDSDRMVLNLYSRVNYVSFTFTARMI
ncbi:hypothetical protein PENTCL1PPCAC_10009 [Pristionchus entomophagus]|uniref:Zinc metalloproteinase n=1 Tax=Pristionchus entomophagus TaxID=358040 RepID=A0AAV5T5M2_9BILA|nr:hypothetical protein PENTCL1PPCAC_10009 [Pristionchus entomophagus]